MRVRVRVGLRARRGRHAHGRRGWWAISPISRLYLAYISPISPLYLHAPAAVGTRTGGGGALGSEGSRSATKVCAPG